MNAERIKQFLLMLSRTDTTQRAGNIVAACPLARWKHKKSRDRHPSFAIKVNDAGRSLYNCFSCGSAGTLDDLLVQLMSYTGRSGNPEHFDLAGAFKMLEDESSGGYIPQTWDEQAYQYKDRYELTRQWPMWWIESMPPAWKVEKANAYLEGRGLNTMEIMHFKVRYDPHRDAVVFPVFNERGWLVGARGRYIDPEDKRRYHDYDWQGFNNTAYVWYNENAVDEERTVVVTEGVIDAIRVWRNCRNVVSPFSISASSSKLQFLKKFQRVIVFRDNDTGGEQMYAKLKEKCSTQLTTVEDVVYPEGSGKDPGSLTDKEIRSMLKSKVILEPPLNYPAE